MTTCSASTRDNIPCRFPARRNTTLCINHDPTYTAQQSLNSRTGTAAASHSRRLLAAQRSDTAVFNLDTMPLADRASIQALLDAVIRLELSGRIPGARTRNLLRALSIAVRNFDTPRSDPNNPNPHQPQAARHNLARYDLTRQAIDANIEALCTEADTRDAARLAPAATFPSGLLSQPA